MSVEQDAGDTHGPGKTAEPSDLPPDVQQANIGNVKKLEEDAVVEPILQYRESRRRKKPAAATKPH